MGSLATREAPGGSSRDQGGTEQKFVGWFLSVCELRRFGPVAGWRESNAAHTAGRPVPPRAAEARPHAPKSGARLFMSVNIFISVTPILSPFFCRCSRDTSRKRIFETYRLTCGTSALALESHQTHLYGSEKTRSGDRSASVKPTRTLLVPQSFHRMSLALCLWLRSSALRRPERAARVQRHMFVSLSGALRPPERASPQPET